MAGEMGQAGATVRFGTMDFGIHRRVDTARRLRLFQNLPVVAQRSMLFSDHCSSPDRYTVDATEVRLHEEDGTGSRTQADC